MSQITCPVCHFAYAASNITNHVRKAHSGIPVSQEAAAAVGLVACTCGQVVLNAVALRKHQGIRKCQGAQSQPASQPAMSQPAVTQPAVSHAMPVAAQAPAQPESAPSRLGVRQDSPFMLNLDPALFAEEEMQVDPPDAGNAPLALVDDNLDFVFAEAEAEAAEEAEPVLAPAADAEDAEMENIPPADASSGEVPAPASIPTLDTEPAAVQPNVEVDAALDPEAETLLQLPATEEPDSEEPDLEPHQQQPTEEPVADASSGEVPALFPIPTLDLPAAEEPDTEPAAPAQSDVEVEADSDPEAETLPQLPPTEEPAPEPHQQQPPPVIWEHAPADQPEDGIVVLLPLTGITNEPLPPLSPPAMLLDQPQQSERPQLPPIPPLAPITDWSGAVYQDVDSFAVTVSPAHLLQLFPAGCYVSLISHAPDFQDLDLFNNWVYFAELKVVFRFEPQFKMPLIARLQQPPQRAILIPSEHATCLTFGDLRLDIGILVQALQDIGCQSVSIGAYGVKVPVDRFLDPAMLGEHPMQEANVFDIGCMVDTGHITLVAPKSKKGKYKQYPSALRVGRGFGSVELRWSSRPDGISQFKGYSKLTHLLKAGAAGAGQAGQPMSIKTVQDRISTLQNWKNRIINTGPEVGNGLRLELTVQAPTMEAARQIAISSRFLDAGYLFSAEAGDLQLLTHTISKAAMFRDLNVLLAVAESKQIFRGNHSTKSTQLQRQVVIDLYNAMGWHPGRRPTALDSMTAWWESSRAALDIAQELEQFSTLASTKQLFLHVKIHLRCQKCHRVGTYTLCGGANQFRIRCSRTECKATLGAQKFRTYLAQLATHRQLGVDLRTLIVDPARLVFAPVPEDNPTRKLSQRRDLNGLVRTVGFADTRESMLECLTLLLEDRRGNPDPVDIREQAVAWLTENTETVEIHVGSRSRPAAEACLAKLGTCFAELTKQEEIVLLHGVAGAFRVSIAHLHILNQSWTCQVVPVGSSGPFLGLVKLSSGYEIVTQAQ